MHELNDFMYTNIPAAALVCNVFLFCTLLTAKKDKAIRSFMVLLVAFIAWTGGSLFMRLQAAPGIIFWWKVSLTGLFLVPYLCYLVAVNYTEQKTYFMNLVWGIPSVIVAVLNLFDVFLTAPQITSESGSANVSYSATMLSVIPVVLAAAVLIATWVVMRRAAKANGESLHYLMPILIGVAIMILGVALDMVPMFNSLPMDTLGCAINAICIYYAFYKKRFYSLYQVTSSGGMFVVSLVAMAMIVPSIYRSLAKKIAANPASAETYYIWTTIICVAAAMLLLLLLNKLNDGLFIKEQNFRENLVKEFSDKANTSFRESDILKLFLQLMRQEIPAEHVYICMYNEENKQYETAENMETLEMPIYILPTNPIIEYMLQHDSGFLYSDFKGGYLYPSMWEEEKRTLEYLEATYILPFKNEDTVMGFAICSGKIGRKKYTYTETNFMDSVSAIAAIALKNAHLYVKMEKEARLDPLTNLYNRREFTRQLNEIINSRRFSPVSMIMFNLDDFSLYNELYGTEEGDRMLQRFASIMSNVFGSKGVLARYAGKEFVVLLPGVDAESARLYAKRVRDRLSQQIEDEKENTKRFLTFSAGICTYPTVASGANELLTFVNLAIFRLKQTGKNQIQIYTKEFEEVKHEDKKEHIYELTSTIYALTAAIDAKDHYTFNHSRCVSEYATQLAHFAGLPEDYIEVIRQAGLLHDIGKISIPDAILTKQGKLTNEEFNIMRQHVERSIEMIRHLPSLDYVIPAVVGHHERYDGTGYPRGIKGEDIPIGARCLTVADCFDAMVSKRSYKEKYPVERALNEIMLNLGTQFDPELGKLFVEKVNSGEIKVIDY